jgi:hypothetical protein
MIGESEEVDAKGKYERMLYLTKLFQLVLEFKEKKILTQFIITHYRDSTCDIEGGASLTSFRNTVNTKRRIAVARKAQLSIYGNIALCLTLAAFSVS